MNRPDGRMFYVHHDLGELPPEPHAMMFLNPHNPFNDWRRGVLPHTVMNISHACECYRQVLPKYKSICMSLQSERFKAHLLHRDYRRHRRRARNCTITRSQLAAHIYTVEALSDTEWSIAALTYVETAVTDYLDAICEFIGVDLYDFENDEFESDE